MRTRQEHKILWRKGIEIFWSVKHSNRQSKWSKHCENKIHAIIISTNNLFFSVYLRIKSDHLDMFFCFFSMDITFYWHSYLLLDFLLLRLTSFIPFSTLLCCTTGFQLTYQKKKYSRVVLLFSFFWSNQCICMHE